MVVPVLATLLNENHLIHPGLGKSAQVLPQLLRRADAALPPLVGQGVTHR
jgi:hypothetical protein